MKKFMLAAAIAAITLSGCGKTAENGAATTEASKSSQVTDKNNVAEISSDNGFEYFFSAYSKSELADSASKELDVELDLSGDNIEPYKISTSSRTEREKKNDSYMAHFTISDVVDGEKINDESYYDGKYAYFSNYKQLISWDDARNAIEGFPLHLIDYTVSNVIVSENDDGGTHVAFEFDLAKLIEAPDEEIFNLLQIGKVSYKQLRFNDASFEGDVSPDGYVTDYVIYYNGYVITANGNINFDYTTTAHYTDINKTSVKLPDDLDSYEEIPAPEGSNNMIE